MIVGHNAARGYLVKLCYEDFMSTGPEGWVPANCLSNQVRISYKDNLAYLVAVPALVIVSNTINFFVVD